MSNVTPSMGLVKWDSVADYFSHSQLAANFQSIDDHDHTSGKGKPIAYGGLAAQAVGSSELRANAVIAAKINTDAVTTNSILNSNITTGKLADGAATASKVKLGRGNAYGSAGSLSLTASYQDVAGATLTFTPDTASTLLVIATFDCNATSAATILGTLLVDGAAQTGTAAFASAVTGERGTVSQTWLVNVTAAAHTFKLQAKASTGTGTVLQSNTSISYLLFSQ